MLLELWAFLFLEDLGRQLDPPRPPLTPQNCPRHPGTAPSPSSPDVCCLSHQLRVYQQKNLQDRNNPYPKQTHFLDLDRACHSLYLMGLPYKDFVKR